MHGHEKHSVGGLAAVAAAAVVMLLLSAGSAAAAFPGNNGRIAFGSQNEIYSVNPDGSGLARLTDQDFVNLLGASRPRWSSDGRRIAYQQNVAFCDLSETDNLCDSISSIRVMNADGSGKTEVHRGFETITGLTWSPDGSKFAYTSVPLFSGPQTPSRIWTVNADGSGLEPLAFGRDPAWSPDGERIAFSGLHSVGDRGTFEIFTVRPDGTGVTRVTHSDPADLVDHRMPSWSPDGLQLVFSEQRPVLDLSTVNADGSGYRKITNSRCIFDLSASCEFYPVWSPDSTKILFMTVLPAAFATVNPDGTGLTRLPDPGVPLAPTITDPWTRQFSPNLIDWQPRPGPDRAEFKNAAKFCAAEREFWGQSAFRSKYGTGPNGANAFGKCVSRSG